MSASAEQPKPRVDATAAGLPVVLVSVPAGAISDLVDRRRLLIASQSFMLAAAVALAGLALAGLVTPWVLLGLIFAAALFFVNALSFVPVIAAVARWRGRARPQSAAAPEHVLEAIRAGARYAAGSPALRVILLRAGLFTFFASSVWALLPLVARTRLHLGSGGYGLLLVGIGAVSGAAAGARGGPD